MELSPAERQLLLAHRLAVFDGCVVYDAQPPVSAEHVQRLAEGLAGPIPEELLRLWRTCFGGRLGYDLEVDYDGHRHPFSFSELFYPDSDGYHDLWGWIEHERELAAEAAAEEGRDWNGKLAYLPFGGFEYLERLYVCVEPGPEHGAVIAWSHGLPPAWAGRLHQDSLTRLADDVGGLFRLLSFEQDPFDAENACGVADELLEALDALEAAGEPGKALKGRLEVLLRQRILDWRPALADGSLAAEPRLRQLALAGPGRTPVAARRDLRPEYGAPRPAIRRRRRRADHGATAAGGVAGEGQRPASGPRQPRRARAQRRQAGQVGKDGQQPQSRRLPGPGRAPGAFPRRAARLRLNPPVPAPR